MGDFEWTEVRRKNHSHANNRVNGSMLAKNLGKFRTKEDDVARISTSVFISNILDSVLAKDLFHACKQYGHVVDSFIPYKKDKKGNRFGFVRFINVFNLERLEDDVARISTSVFISNIPDFVLAKDLFYACKQYGHVVDSFIPYKRDKKGNRFGFVRFINVFNLERLVKILCTVWIDRYKIQANVEQFQRTPGNVVKSVAWSERSIAHSLRTKTPPEPVHVAPSFVSAVKGDSPSIPASVSISTSPALVIDDAFVIQRDLSNYVMGEVKHISSIVNICSLLSIEGFNNVKPTYMGGLWVILELESSDVKAKIMKHVGVASWFDRLCEAEPDFVFWERIVWVDIKGVPLHAWSHATFKKIGSKWGEVMDIEEEEVINKDGNNNGDGIIGVESDIDGVSETAFGDLNDGLDMDQVESVKDKECSSDPFNIYHILNKHKTDPLQPIADTSLTHPPGFTPERNEPVTDSPHTHFFGLNSRIIHDTELSDESANSDGNFKKKGLRTGGSMLDVLDDMIKVGLGSKAKKSWIRELNIKHKVSFFSIQETKSDAISDMEIKFLWGNSVFESSVSEAIGCIILGWIGMGLEI
nr:hypothetical protein [Tanacetum cinerariifolium]